MWDLIPQPGMEPGTLTWERRVSATGPPGKSSHLLCLFFESDTTEVTWHAFFESAFCLPGSIGSSGLRKGSLFFMTKCSGLDLGGREISPWASEERCDGAEGRREVGRAKFSLPINQAWALVQAGTPRFYTKKSTLRDQPFPYDSHLYLIVLPASHSWQSAKTILKQKTA